MGRKLRGPFSDYSARFVKIAQRVEPPHGDEGLERGIGDAVASQEPGHFSGERRILEPRGFTRLLSFALYFQYQAARGAE